jgi:hypothetical protein
LWRLWKINKLVTLSPEIARELIEFYRAAKASGLLNYKGVFEPPRLTPLPPMFVKNVSGEVIPACACMQAIDTLQTANQNYLEVQKPTDVTGESGVFVFNSEHQIAVDGFGIAFGGPVVRAKSTATTGRCRPQIGSWTVAAHVDGIFNAIGPDDFDTNIAKISCVAAPTVVQQVITDVRVDGTDLQKKTRNVLVYASGAESDWTTYHAGSQCEDA